MTDPEARTAETDPDARLADPRLTHPDARFTHADPNGSPGGGA
jgi:hypothetical protein